MSYPARADKLIASLKKQRDTSLTEKYLIIAQIDLLRGKVDACRKSEGDDVTPNTTYRWTEPTQVATNDLEKLYYIKTF